MSQYNDYVWAEVYNQTGNEYGTAALMGNLQAESGIIPYRLQGDFTSTYYKSINYTDNVNSGVISRDEFIHDGKGYGLAQWTYYTRKEALYDAWQNSGYASIGDIRFQVSFLLNEIQSSYPTVYSAIVNATNIRDASDIVLVQFENPADQSLAVKIYRAGLGDAIYIDLATGQPIPIPVPVPPDTPTEPTIPIWLLFKVGKH